MSPTSVADRPLRLSQMHDLDDDDEIGLMDDLEVRLSELNHRSALNRAWLDRLGTEEMGVDVRRPPWSQNASIRDREARKVMPCVQRGIAQTVLFDELRKDLEIERTRTHELDVQARLPADGNWPVANVCGLVVAGFTLLVSVPDEVRAPAGAGRASCAPV